MKSNKENNDKKPVYDPYLKEKMELEQLQKTLATGLPIILPIMFVNNYFSYIIGILAGIFSAIIGYQLLFKDQK